jgi:hyperosmotically inducible periplasmic protein
MVKKILIASLLAVAGYGCGHRNQDHHSGTKTYHESSRQAASEARDSEEFRDADNTAMNKRDAHESNLTPPDQSKGSMADVELTRKIRRAIVDDETLSVDAQNIKIITLKGMTTLRGPVETMSEKSKIERLAKKAGAKKITNELEVTAKAE